MAKSTYIIVVLLLIAEAVKAQQDGSPPAFLLHGTVTASDDTQEVAGATIRAYRQKKLLGGTVSDSAGHFVMKNLPADVLHLHVTAVGYQPADTTIQIQASGPIRIYMSAKRQSMKEVVVTASEQKGMTSATIIGQTAMEHLQPSSFADLLALLPGGMTKPPSLGSANIITLREAGSPSSQYATSSLGTKFVIDGQAIGTDANMQYIAGTFQGDADNSRNHTSYGVDMREIPTDNIEKVEIIRGIPSVKYGELTSGLISITRKHTQSPLQLRLKADEYGKLVSLGKGFLLSGKWNLNVDGGLLDARKEPRNRFETYRRLTFSARLQRKWDLGSHYVLEWNGATDYALNIDNVKTDPEIQIHKDDRYRSSYLKMGLNQQLMFRRMEQTGFRSALLTYAASIAFDRIHQTEAVALQRDYAVPLAYESGEYDGLFLPFQYVCDYRVEGIPFYSTVRGETEWAARTASMRHRITAGAEFLLNKNYGRGQIFDITRPLHASTARRPRSYKEIPATDILSFYAEDNATMPVGRHRLTLMGGIRTTQLLNIPGYYAIHGRIFTDTRINAQWDFPQFAGFRCYVSGGFGMMTKMPTILDLYPDYIYKDITELNYWDIRPEYKRIHIRTYKLNPVNPDLQPARNRKWEIRMGVDRGAHHFNLTCFQEDMKDGFRSTTTIRPFTYRKYATSAIDPSKLTGPPALDALPSVTDTILDGYGTTENGSRIKKRGIEFQYSSPRIPVIQTRITVNGAWFRTVYENSIPLFRSAPNVVVGGVAVADRYAGYYLNTDRYDKQIFTSNFIFDSYIDRLGLILSATSECFWMSSTKRPPTSSVPMGYMDITGTVHPYTEADKNDPYLRWLVLSGTAGQDMSNRERSYMLVNFKATKRFGKHLSLSFFADRVLYIAPDYEVNGFTVRRTFSPYFGMEMGLKI